MEGKFPKKVKVYCDHAKQQVEFDFFQLPKYRDAFGVVCCGPGADADIHCRGSKGCALYEKFWFDGSIANMEQQRILKDTHRRDPLEWEEKCIEWLKKHKKHHTRLCAQNHDRNQRSE